MEREVIATKVAVEILPIILTGLGILTGAFISSCILRAPGWNLKFLAAMFIVAVSCSIAKLLGANDAFWWFYVLGILIGAVVFAALIISMCLSTKNIPPDM